IGERGLAPVDPPAGEDDPASEFEVVGKAFPRPSPLTQRRDPKGLAGAAEVNGETRVRPCPVPEAVRVPELQCVDARDPRVVRVLRLEISLYCLRIRLRDEIVIHSLEKVLADEIVRVEDCENVVVIE